MGDGVSHSASIVEATDPGGGSLLTVPYAVTSSCTLAEDYLMVNPRAATSGDDKVAAFQLGDAVNAGGGTHLVAMIPDPTSVSSLFHVYPDASSAGGWTTAPIADTAEVVDFVVANLFNPSNQPTGADNTVELYCRKATGVDIYRLAPDGVTWQANGNLPWTAPLQVDYVLGLFEGSIATVYCFDKPKGTISWRQTVTAGPQHTVNTGTLTGTPVVTMGTVALTALDTGSMVVTACEFGGKVATFRPAATSGQLGEPAISTLPDGAQVAGVRAMGSWLKASFAVVSDTAGDLWTVAASGMTKIWDGQAAGSADDVAALQVFPATGPLLDLLVRSGDKLWLIHQVHQPGTTSTSPLDATDPQFAPPTPLQAGAASAVVALSPTQSDDRTVVTVDPTGAIAVLSQPAGGQAWRTQPVLLAGSEAEQLDTYRVQLSFTDANGIPVTGTPVSITAGSPILALAGTTSQTLGPTAAAAFTTDSYGRVVFAVLAKGLYTPDLTVSAPNLPAPVTVSPAAQVQAFLSGNGTLHAAGYGLTATNLQAATANGTPLAHGLDHDTATAAVGLMATAINTGNGHPPGLGKPPRLGAAPGPVLGSASVGSLEISLSDFGADIWHAIKTAAVEVTDIAHDATGAIQSVAVKLEGWGTALIDATVTSIQDAINVVHSVFNQIAAAIEDAIAWLRAGVLELLHDAAALADQMYTWLSAAPAYLSSTAQNYRGQLNDALDRVKDQMKTSLVDTSVLPAGTLADLAATKPAGLQAPPGPGLPGDTPTGVDPASFSSNDHANWLLHKVLDELSGSLTPVSGQLAQQLSTLNSTFTSSFSQNLQELQNALITFWSDTFGISTTGKTANPQGVRRTGVAAMTAALVPIVDALIDLAEIVLDDLLDLVTAVANLLQQYIFDATLGDLPLIGSLLRGTAIGELSFGKLICLIVAFPVALIYQLSHPAGASSLASLLTPASADSQVRLAAADDTIDAVRRWLSTGAQGVWAFFDVILDVASVSTPLTSAIDIITPILIGTVTCPGQGAPFADVPDATTADRMLLASWVTGFLPPLASAGLYLDPTEKKTLRNTYNGPMLISGLGLYILIFGIVANGIGDADAGTWIATILGGLTVVDGVLGSKDLTTPSAEGTLAVKIVIDFFCGLGAAVGMAIA